MRIRYTRAALDDFSEIHTYIAEDNPAAARGVVGSLRDAVEMLADFPEIGRLGNVTGTREFVVPRLPYIIVYQISDREVRILNVFHGARDRR